jgi:O-antigen biosynthesis protein
MRQIIMPFGVYTPPMPVAPQQVATNPRPAELDLPRFVHYPADQSGCSAWRMSWVGHLMNYHQKAMVQESTVMITNPEWYQGVKVVRIQRQATPHQKEFVKFLKSLQPQIGFRLVYEIDDIVFREDIPEYNKFKFAFDADEIRNSSMEIMQLCDEVSTTNPFIAKYYKEKANITSTVIPNFPARWWIGNFYNESRIKWLYDQNKKKPRILYAGSGAHFDVDNKTGQKDDFEHVIKAIVDTRHKFQWVFLGAFPLSLKPYIDNKDIEFHQWQRFYEYPKKISELDITMMVAPLQDNNFNKAKSDLKYIEACCGLPIACQDLVTYEQAPIKFKTGSEMIEQIEATIRDHKAYRQNIPFWRSVAEDRFLEHDKNIDCYLELQYACGSNKRVNLNRYN